MPNKKISQLVNKTTILPTDLFPLGDATTGQLFKKTVAELQAAIGGAVVSVNGLVGVVVLDTDDIQELGTPTNRYFTDARARAVLSAVSPIVYNSSTGAFSIPGATTSVNGYLTSTDWTTFNGKENVLTFSSPLVRASNTVSIPVATTSVNGYLSSTDWTTFNSKQGALSLTVSGSSGASTLIANVLNIPTYTLAGLGGITASFLSGGAGISYNSGTGVVAYTGNIYTDASIRGLFSASTGLSYNSSTGAFTNTITQYTDALARGAISLTTTGTSGASTYNSTTGVLNIPTYTLAGLGGITASFLSGGTGISYSSSTGVISYSGTVYTDASIRNLFFASTGLSYNSTTGTFTNTITQYTDALARGAISLTVTGSSGASTYNSTTGVLNVPTYTLAGLGGISGSGTTNYIPKFTSASAIGNSQVFDNGSGVTINGTTVGEKFNINGYIGFQRSNTQYWHVGSDSSNSLSFTRSNIAERMVLSSDGNLGLGVTPSAWSQGKGFEISALGEGIWGNGLGDIWMMNGAYFNAGWLYSGTTKATAYRQGAGTTDGSHSWHIAPSGTAGNAITFTQAMTLGSNGNLAVGTTDTTQYRILAKQNGADTFGIASLASNNTSIIRMFHNGTLGAINVSYIGGGSYTPLAFFTSDTERMRITSGGNILMGTTTDNGERLYVSGAIRATGTITANSDISLKKNLLRIENALEKVGLINGYTYNLKDKADSKRYGGVIAQEIDKVFPEIVNKGNDGLLGVEYGNISALLIEALKELKEKNTALELRLLALEN